MQADPLALKAGLASIENDWKIREEALAALLQSFGAPGESSPLLEFIGSIPEPLAFQFADLRSGIVKLASEVVSAYARTAGAEAPAAALAFADRLLQEPSYYKALGSGNKVIAKHAQNAIRALVVHKCVSLDILKRVFATQKANKINFIRENVAESFVTFLKNAVLPNKKLLGSNHSVGAPMDLEVAEGTGASEPGMAIENEATQATTEGLGKTGGSEMDVLVGTQQIREDNFDFLKTVCEAFMKDSSPGVRNSGKQMKADLAKIQEMFLSRQETNASVFSNEAAEDPEALEQFGRTESSGMVIESHTSSQPVSKVASNTLAHSRASLSKNLPVEEKILRLLRADTKAVKDQTEELEKLIVTSTAPLVFTFDQYIEVLTAFNIAKNLNLKATCGRILTRSDISHFQFAILDHLLKEKLMKRTGFSQVAKYIIDRVSFEVLLNLMITRTYEELIGLVNKAFCAKKLHKAVTRHEVEAQDIASAVQRNYLKADTAGIVNVAQFRSQNMAFLQKVFGESDTAALFVCVEWTPAFVEKMREANVDVEQIKTTCGVSDGAGFGLREGVGHLTGAASEGQLVGKLSDILSTTTLNELQKTEFTQLMMTLVTRKQTQTVLAGPDAHLTEAVRSCVCVLMQQGSSKSVVLSYLAIWGAVPAVLTPEWSLFLVSLCDETLKSVKGDGLRTAAECFVILGTLTPLGVGALIDLLNAPIDDAAAVSLCGVLRGVCQGLQGSPEAPNFILQFNSHFQAFVVAATRLLNSPKGALQTAAASAIASVSQYANPISYAAFWGSLGADQQHMVTLSGLN